MPSSPSPFEGGSLDMMRPPIMQVALFRDHAENEQELARSVLSMLFLLDALVAMDRLWLQTYPEAPNLYESGVRYVYKDNVEAPAWQDIPATLAKGYGDCKDFAAWRVAELLERVGVAARPYVQWRMVDGAYRLHALVQLPDGTLEDPSKQLGMGDFRPFVKQVVDQLAPAEPDTTEGMGMNPESKAKAVLAGFVHRDPKVRNKARAAWQKLNQAAVAGDTDAAATLAGLKVGAAKLRVAMAGRPAGVSEEALGVISWQGKQYNTTQQFAQQNPGGFQAWNAAGHPGVAAGGPRGVAVTVSAQSDVDNVNQAAMQMGVTPPAGITATAGTTNAATLTAFNAQLQALANQLSYAQAQAAQYGDPGPQTQADLAAWPARLQQLQQQATQQQTLQAQQYQQMAVAQAQQAAGQVQAQQAYQQAYAAAGGPPQGGGGYDPSQMQPAYDDGSDGMGPVQDDGADLESQMNGEDDDEMLGGTVFDGEQTILGDGDDTALKIGQLAPTAAPIIGAIAGIVPVVGQFLAPLTTDAVKQAGALLVKANSGDAAAKNQIINTAAQAAAGDPKAQQDLDALKRVNSANKAIGSAMAAGSQRPVKWGLFSLYDTGFYGGGIAPTVH
jgi:hypothetical protein